MARRPKPADEKNTKREDFTLPEGLHTRLEEVVRRRKDSKANYIRSVLADRIEQDEADLLYVEGLPPIERQLAGLKRAADQATRALREATRALENGIRALGKEKT